MPTFVYQAYTATGASRRGRMEGLHPKEIRERLLKEGLYAREVRALSHSRGGGFGLAERAVLYRELGALLQAGLPLDKALAVLSENPELLGGADLLARVRDEVREGRGLSRALEERLRGIRGDEVAVLASGEAAGNLAGVCLDLAEHVEGAAEVREQIRTALVYPALVSGLALLVLGVMVGVLLPVYDRLLGGLNQPMPPFTAFVLGIGRVLRHPAGLLALAGVAALLLRSILRLRRHPDLFLPRLRYKLPILGAALASLARARFARTLSMLLQGGVPLPAALITAGQATGSARLAEACRGVSEQVSQGTRLADALENVPVLGQDVPGWVRAGEASGGLADLLSHAARGYGRAWERGLRRALALLEPLLIVAVGLLILGVALAVLLPMLRLNRSLGG
jgi:general secretion pathway protein F